MALKVGDLFVRLGLKNELSEGLRRIQGELQSISMVAAGAFTGIALAMGKATRESNELNSALLGLTTVAKGTGNDLQAATQAAQALASDGLMTVGDAATGLKNLLAAGFNLDQAVRLMNAFKDSAAFGRQAALGFGEAIRGATEGIKNGNSVLVDNAGVTKNLSVILEEAGYSAQDLQKATTDVNVRMALYNGILKEAAINQGDAARLTETLSGAQARLSATAREAWQSLGQALEPAIRSLVESITPAIKGISEWIKQNPELASKIAVVAAATTGLTAALTAFGAVIPSIVSGVTTLKTALALLAGPAGIIAAVTTGVIALIAAFKYGASQMDANREKADVLGRRYEELSKRIEDGALSAEEKAQADDELRSVMDQIAEIMPELVEAWDEEGRAIALNTEEIRRNREERKKLKEEQSQERIQALALEIAGLEAEKERVRRSAVEDRERAISSYIAASGQSPQTPEALEALRRKAEAEFDAAIARQLRDIDERQKRLGDLLDTAVAEEGATGDASFGRRELGPGRRFNMGTTSTGTTNKGTAGAGSKDQAYANPALDAALENLRHLKAINEMSLADEEEYLQRVLAKHVKTAEEKRAVEEMLYNVRRQIRDKGDNDEEEARRGKLQGALRFLEHEKRMGRLNVEDEIAGLQRILDTYKLTDEERMDLLERVRDLTVQAESDKAKAAKDAADQAAADQDKRYRDEIKRIDHLRATGEMSRDEEIAALQKVLEWTDLTTDQRWSIEERLYSLREDARQEDLRNEEKAARDREKLIRDTETRIRKDLQKKMADEDRDLKARFKAEQDSIQATIEGLQGKLKLLDRQYDAEDRLLRLQEIRERRTKTQEALNKVLADKRFELITESGQRILTHDIERARELQDELNDINKDEAALFREEEREKQRQSLQDQIDFHQKRLANLREAQQKERDEWQLAWENRLSDENIQQLALQDIQANAYKAQQDALTAHLSNLKGQWEGYAAGIKAILAAITAPLAAVALPAGVTQAAAAVAAASGAGGTGTAPVTINVKDANFPNVTDANSFIKDLTQLAVQAVGVMSGRR